MHFKLAKNKKKHLFERLEFIELILERVYFLGQTMSPLTTFDQFKESEKVFILNQIHSMYS